MENRKHDGHYREEMSSDGKYHSSFVYISIYTILKNHETQHSALQLRCAP